MGKIYTWDVVRSIDDVDADMWNTAFSEINSRAHVRYMSMVESANNDNSNYYLVGYGKDDTVIGLAYWQISRFDLLQAHADSRWLRGLRRVYPNLLRVRVGSTSPWELYGQFFWWDPDVLDSAAFFSSLSQEVRKLPSSPLVDIVRDFLYEDEPDPALRADLGREGFVLADSVAFSGVFPDKGADVESFLSNLKAKKRNYIRKVLKSRSGQSLTLEHVVDFMPILDEIYPLYLMVHHRASEVHVPTLPRTFFSSVKNSFGDDSRVILLKKEDVGTIGFVLLIKNEDVLCTYLFGADHAHRDNNIWYQCVWESIEYGIAEGVSEVDLGASNQSMKRKLGAAQRDSVVFLRFRNPLLNFALKRFLPALA